MVHCSSIQLYTTNVFLCVPNVFRMCPSIHVAAVWYTAVPRFQVIVLPSSPPVPPSSDTSVRPPAARTPSPLRLRSRQSLPKQVKSRSLRSLPRTTKSKCAFLWKGDGVSLCCVCVCVCVCVLVNHIKTSSDILTHTTHNNQRVSFVQEIFDHLSQGLIFYFSTFLLYLVHLNPN
jgi:hypothetical protein